VAPVGGLCSRTELESEESGVMRPFGVVESRPLSPPAMTGGEREVASTKTSVGALLAREGGAGVV
jgi:hypothetical protein